MEEKERAGAHLQRILEKKISEANKGRKMSEDNKRKLIAANKGRKLSEQHRANLVKNHKGNTGKKFSDEIKKKMSKSSAKAREVIDISTGYVWSSCKEAAQVYGINYTYLANQLNGHRKNKTNLRYA